MAKHVTHTGGRTSPNPRPRASLRQFPYRRLLRLARKHGIEAENSGDGPLPTKQDLINALATD